MANYKINPNSADIKQAAAGHAGVTETSTVYKGVAKGLGSNQTLLDNQQHGAKVDIHGSQVYEGSSDVHKANSSGNFAKMTAEKYVMKRVTTELAGIANTDLRSGGHHNPGVIESIKEAKHQYTTRIATAIRNGDWNEYTGKFSSTPTTADDQSTMGSDHATTVDASRPGSLTYKISKALPVNTTYEAKTNY